MDYEDSREIDEGAESANLGPEIASIAASAGRSGAVLLLPGEDNTVVLPQGATIDDVQVSGRDLVISLPDGSTYVIPDGAVFVPVLVVDGVAVPPLNLAALLTGDQPQPAAGSVQSSGGNFADPADPIQAAYDLGNLLPYTELAFPEPQDEEIIPNLVDNEPAITFVPRNGDGTQVPESHLPPTTSVRTDESEGSEFDGDDDTTSNVIEFVSLDGVDTITINGVTLDPGQFPQVVSDDDIGTLTVTGLTFDDTTGNGTISYTYTLNDNTTDPDGSQVEFDIVLTDPDGDVAEDVLVIDIIDDVPTAVEDFDTVAEGGTTTGNVLPNDEFGADGPTATTPAGGVIGVRADDGDTTTPVTTGTGLEIRGDFGTLTLNADGSYTYVADANITDTDVEDVFVYTIEDGDLPDGDLSTTTLTITLADVTLVGDDERVIVDEAALDLARDGADLAPGVVTGSDPASTDETVSGAVNVAGATGFAIVGSETGTYGVIAIGNDGNFTYTLTTRFDNLPHADDGTETEPAGEVFTYEATDANGNSVTGTITIDIIDDIPTARADIDMVEEGGTATGNVLPNDEFGADGPGETAPAGGVIGVRADDGDTTTPVTTGTGTQIRGDFGDLVLNADGSYTYVADTNIVDADMEDVFVYTIVDGDGDRSTTTLTITVKDITIAIGDNDAQVDESGLDGIGSQLAPDGEFYTSGQITAAGASGQLTYMLTSPADGTYGTLVLNMDTGAFSYTLDTPFDEPDTDNGRDTIDNAESFGYEVKDQNGNVIGSGTIDIDIVDDVPIARPDFDSVAELSSTSGDVLPNDTFGADGSGGGVIGVRAASGDSTSDVLSGVGVVVAGLHGDLTLNGDGSYTYTAGNVTGAQQDIFVYTIRDGDGDLATTTLTINIADIPPPANEVPTAGQVGATLDDDALANGNPGDNGDGSDDAPDTSNLAGTLPGAGGDGALTWAFATTGAPAGFTYVPSGNSLLIQQGGSTVITVTLNPANGSYSILQNSAIDHAAGDTENNQVFTISYTVSDADVNTGPADEATGTLTINADDDTPTATATANPDGAAQVDETAASSGTPTLATTSLKGDDPDVAGTGTIGSDMTGSAVVTAGGSFGADGLGALTYALTVVSATSGLTATDGSPISLVNEGGVIVGQVQGGTFGGQAAFAFGIDSSTGLVTLEQYLSVFHSDDTNPNDFHSLATGSLGATVTRSDDDGDSITSDAADISSQFSFFDDGPTANNDVDSLAGGSSGPATGNVLTAVDIVGGDTNTADGVADLDGADGGAVVVGVAKGDTGTELESAGTVGASVAGDHGTLTIDANGDYSYTRTSTTSGDFTDVFTYTMEDTDGDKDTATLTITIGDATPIAGEQTVKLDDDLLPNGIDNGPGDDDPDIGAPVPATGNLIGSGGDGTLTFAMANTGPPAGFSYDTSTAGTLLIKQGTTTVVTVVITDSATGAYSITQNNPVIHPDGNDENNQIFTIAYSVTDQDSDVANGTLTIDTDDDTPTATLVTSPTVPMLVTDDTDTPNDTAGPTSFAGLFTTAFGADGGKDNNPADGSVDADAISYALSVTGGNGVDSGLDDTLTGDNILLRLVGTDTIEGYLASNTAVVAFTITVDADTGTVSLEQDRAIVHDDPTDPVETGMSAATLAAGLVNLTATVTDRDLDSDSATADITGAFKFEDDGPSISVVAQPTVPMLVTDDTDTPNDTAGPTSFASLFTSSFGKDDFKDADDNDVEDADAIAYALVLNGGNGVDSGLDDTLTGDNILLRLVGTDTIEGYLASNTAVVAFTITVNADTGTVSLEQDRAIVHDDVNDPVETGAAAETLAAGLISLKATITDGDLDTDDAMIDITGAFKFEDDGPLAADDTDSVASGTTGPATGNVLTGTEVAVAEDTNGTDGVADDPGSDGFGRVTFIDHSDAAAGQAVADGGSTMIAGDYGTLTIFSNGDYSYARTAGQGGGQSEVFTYTMTDGDGDTDTATLTITILNETPAAGTVNAVIDDDDVSGANGIPGGTGDLAPSNTAGTLPDPAAGDAPLTYALANTGAPVGFTYDNSTAGTLLIKQSGTTVVTVTYNTATGAYTIVQNAVIDHPDALDENNVDFAIAYTITDNDSEVANGTLNIKANDDTPTATATADTNATVMLDETATTSGVSALGVSTIGDDPDVPGVGTIATATSGSAIVTAGGGYGADGPGTLTYALSVTNATSGLTVTDGSAINLVNEGGVIVGRVQAGTFSGDAAFAISINSTTGVVTVEQYLSLNHPITTDHDDTVFLANGSLGATVTRTDGDNDSVTSTAADVSGLISFDDDGPGLGAIQDGTANNVPASAVSTGTLNFVSGSDGVGSPIAITYDTTGVMSGGQALVTQQVGNVLTAYAGSLAGTPVFTLTVNSGTDQYTFDLLAPLDGVVTPVAIGAGSSFGVGPSDSIVVTDNATMQDLVFVTGWEPGGGFDEATWLTGSIPDLVQRSDINGSTSGWGLANNNFDAPEFIRFDFGSLNDYDAAGSYVPPGGVGPVADVTFATFEFFNFGAGDTIKLVAHYTDSSTQSFELDGAVDPDTLTITAPLGVEIAWVDVYESAGSIKLNLTSVGVRTTDVDHDLDFTVTIPDGDGDTASDSFTINVADGNSPSTAAPVVLDLDGDGAEFLAIDAGVAHDYGFGLVATAWVAADDGLLARQAAEGLDIVFTDDGEGAATDLEGVRANYDSDGDGQLTASDAAWGEFGVWQDADSDGVTDVGEFASLDDLGIVSISLISDGKAYSAANDDVTVHGEATFARADGSTGVLADASFAVGQQRIAARSQEIATNAVAAGVAASMLIEEAGLTADVWISVSDQGGNDHMTVQTASLPMTISDDIEAGSIIYLGSIPGSDAGQPAERTSAADAVSEYSDDGMQVLIDHYSANAPTTVQEPSSFSTDASESLILAGSPGDAGAMQGLLMLTEIPASAEGGDETGPVEEALAVADGESFVDQLVDKLGSHEVVDGSEGATSNLEALLATNIGSDPAFGQNAFNLDQTVEEATAMASA